MKLFVGSLPYSITEDELREIFAVHGDVTSVKIVTDRETGRARGFGFVEMGGETEADAAVKALNGSEVQGRKIVVDHARDKASGGSRGGHGGGRRF